MHKLGLSLLLGGLAAVASIALAQAPAPLPAASPSAPPTSPAPGVAAPAKPVTAGFAGYLPRGAAPNSLALLAAPPATGSATQARDNAMAKIARALKGSPRWSQATLDADLKFPGAANTYSCAVGVDINPKTTPRLYTLLTRVLVDAGLATYPAKTKYQRPRPFMVAGGDICTPAADAGLRKDGSYPSGHASAGWAWALILAEAAPERQDAILARGRAFMQSRVICNVHWLSDTEAGSLVGTSVVARLHDDPVFRADLEAAKAEITAARAAGQAPTRDCKAEAAALSMDPMPAP